MVGADLEQVNADLPQTFFRLLMSLVKSWSDGKPHDFTCAVEASLGLVVDGREGLAVGLHWARPIVECENFLGLRLVCKSIPQEGGVKV